MYIVQICFVCREVKKHWFAPVCVLQSSLSLHTEEIKSGHKEQLSVILKFLFPAQGCDPRHKNSPSICIHFWSAPMRKPENHKKSVISTTNERPAGRANLLIQSTADGQKLTSTSRQKWDFFPRMRWACESWIRLKISTLHCSLS